MSIDDVPANRRRGGDIRTILSPATVGATSGFLGTLRLEPGEVVTEHWHPYSEEFLFCVAGRDHAAAGRRGPPLRANEGVLIPIGVRHRLINDGDEHGVPRLPARPAGAPPRSSGTSTPRHCHARGPP